MSNILNFRSEISQALRNFDYERTASGIYLNKSKAFIGGVFSGRVNDGPRWFDANTVVNQGLDDILKVYFAQSAQQTAFYIAPFSGNVAPAPTLDAAHFTSVQTEFINYNESTRQLWAKDAEAAQSIANATTPAVFTIGTGGGTVWGAGMLTASARSSTSGVLVAASQFGAARALLQNDKLSLEYMFTAADA